MPALRTTCRSCGAPVVMVRHERTRKPAPLEPDPNGRWTYVGDTYFPASPRLSPDQRYSSHFATCPAAASHRAPATGSTA